VGTGEALNEHILGHRWPPPEVRLKMLEEAVHVMRLMWSGETVDHRGDFYEVDNARLFDPPTEPIEVIVSAYGPVAAQLAARIGDGYRGNSPDESVVGRHREAGGGGPMYAQINVCVGADEEKCQQIIHQWWANGGVPGQLPQDLPTFTHFEQAVSVLSRDQTTAEVTIGQDPDRIVAAVQPYLDARYDHIYFHQIGPDPRPLFDLWTSALHDALPR